MAKHEKVKHAASYKTNKSNKKRHNEKAKSKKDHDDNSQPKPNKKDKNTKSKRELTQDKKKANRKSEESDSKMPVLSRFLNFVKGDKDDETKRKSKNEEHELSKIPTAHRNKTLEKIKEQPRITGEVGKRIYCSKLMTGFAPFRYFAILTGHFPFVHNKNTDGSYEFRFKWTSLNTVVYFLNGLFTISFLLTGGITIFVLTSQLNLFEYQKQPIHKETVFYELVLIQRHYVFLWSLAAAGCCSVIAFIHTFLKRQYIPSIYSYYFKVIRLLHVDLHEGTKFSGIFMITMLFITIFTIFIMGLCKFAPMTRSVPLIVGDFMYGHFFGIRTSTDEIWILNRPIIRYAFQALGSLTIFCIYTSSKATILLFMFHCKVLKNAFATWNGRAYIYIMKSAKYMVTEEGAERLKLLYKDHCLILDLMEGVNTSFAMMVETFYSFQMGAAFFELYFFLRTAKAGSDIAGSGSQEPGSGDYFIRPWDWAPGILIFVQALMFVIITSKAASDVGEEAIAGVDIVRRRMFLHRKTDEDLYFQLSMQNSFDSYRRFDIAGGQYGYINKDFIQGWVNTMAGYFIILYQFQPVMDLSHKNDPEKRKAIGLFLNIVEGLKPANHWMVTEIEQSPIITASDL